MTPTPPLPAAGQPGEPQGLPQGRVIVLGAGVAGLLAALALQARGLAVTVVDTTPPVDDAAAPPPEPVHRLPAALWLDPPAWLAGLGEALRAQGVGPGVLQLCSVEGCARERWPLLPDKASLHAALGSLLQARPGVQRWRLPRLRLQWAGGLWQLSEAAEVVDGPPAAPTGLLQAAALVDASGGRRALQTALLAACGDAGALELSGERQRYRSFTLAAPAPAAAGLWLLRDRQAQTWLVHQAASGRLSVTERLHGPEAGADAAAGPGTASTAALLARLLAAATCWRQKTLLQVLARAEPAGAPALYRAPPARRWQLPEAVLAGRLPCCAVGDALVQTPPWLGQGVAQAALHAHTLATLPAAAGWPGQAAAVLDGTAAGQLQAAALAAWAETLAETETHPLTTETSDAPSFPPSLRRHPGAGRPGARARPTAAAARRPVGEQLHAEDQRRPR
jgi:2-polyprenyl-6-methoxyphenol hydroxylase-like FAD-dependent oxidoreductase